MVLAVPLNQQVNLQFLCKCFGNNQRFPFFSSRVQSGISTRTQMETMPFIVCLQIDTGVVHFAKVTTNHEMLPAVLSSVDEHMTIEHSRHFFVAIKLLLANGYFERHIFTIVLNDSVGGWFAINSSCPFITHDTI
jgi:hypothetical protein